MSSFSFVTPAKFTNIRKKEMVVEKTSPGKMVFLRFYTGENKFTKKTS